MSFFTRAMASAFARSRFRDEIIALTQGVEGAMVCAPEVAG
jgi:hypothetical protein